MTVGEIVGEGLGVHFNLTKLETQKRIDKVLDDVGIEIDAKNKYPHEFSEVNVKNCNCKIINNESCIYDSR